MEEQELELIGQVFALAIERASQIPEPQQKKSACAQILNIEARLMEVLNKKDGDRSSE